MAGHDTHQRTIIKGITYTGTVVVADILVIAFITHKVEVTVQLIVGTNLVSLIIYYLHSHIWSHISWGLRRTKRTGA